MAALRRRGAVPAQDGAAEDAAPALAAADGATAPAASAAAHNAAVAATAGGAPRRRPARQRARAVLPRELVPEHYQDPHILGWCAPLPNSPLTGRYPLCNPLATAFRLGKLAAVWPLLQFSPPPRCFNLAAEPPCPPTRARCRRYRPPGGFRKNLASLFRLHNETGNVWSHLIGFLIFVCLTAATVHLKPAPLVRRRGGGEGGAGRGPRGRAPQHGLACLPRREQRRW